MNTKWLFLFALPGIILFSCKKKECDCPSTAAGSSASAFDNSITYPDSVYYGRSILAMPDSTVLNKGVYYGFGAQLGKDATLQIKLINLSVPDSAGPGPVWFYSPSTFWWFANDYDFNQGSQRFTATANGKIDMQLFFNGTNPGKCRVEFYENSTSVTRVKYLKW